MAVLNDGRGVGGVAVEAKTKGLRVVQAPRGAGYSVSGSSGLIAAVQALGSLFFSIRSNPASPMLIFIERLRVQYVTIAAYTVPLTVGRRLSLYRGYAATPTGGTALAPTPKDSLASTSQVSAANNGDARIATTAGLTQSNIVWEAQPFREITLTPFGTAGSQVENLFDFSPSANSPIVLQPGQILGIRNPQAMDAAGTWMLQVDMDWHESAAWSSSAVD